MIVLVGFVMVALFYAAHQADRLHHQSNTLSNNAISQLSGTYKNSMGDVWHFRMDGTGRSYDPARSKSDVRNFEWMSDGSTLTIVNVPKGKLVRFIAHIKDDLPTSFFLISSQSPDPFTITDPPSGESTVFERTNDPFLNNAD